VLNQNSKIQSFNENTNNNSRLHLRPFVSVDDTVKEIFNMVDAEWQKPYLQNFDALSLKQIFNYISQLPYVPDPVNDVISGNDDIELIKTPELTNYTGGDCDDKSAMMGAILKRRGIPFRFAVTSTKPDGSLHHIYPEIEIDGFWVPFDATYSYNQPFVESVFTKKRIYDNNCGHITSFEVTKNLPASHTAAADCNQSALPAYGFK